MLRFVIITTAIIGCAVAPAWSAQPAGSPNAAAIRFVLDPTWPQKPQSFTWGQMPGIAIDAADQVYIYNRNQPAVQVYRPDGAFVHAWDTEPCKGAHFIKIDPEGNELWTSTFGDPDMIDYGSVLAQTLDGGFVTAGERVTDLYTWDADISLVKIDGDGELVWEQIIKTDAHCVFGTILQHPDGGYVIAGSAFNGRAFDIFMIKTDAEGNVERG